MRSFAGRRGPPNLGKHGIKCSAYPGAKRSLVRVVDQIVADQSQLRAVTLNDRALRILAERAYQVKITGHTLFAGAEQCGLVIEQRNALRSSELRSCNRAKFLKIGAVVLRPIVPASVPVRNYPLWPTANQHSLPRLANALS